MNDLLHNPTAMKNLSYAASGGLGIFGIISVQDLAIIFSAIFAALTWWQHRRATNARRREEMERHEIESEFIKVRKERAEQQAIRDQELHELKLKQLQANVEKMLDP